tara:strand:- start:666 stop:1142 length:477 start_codon:yes stop_codon:yes gene_type:complete
MLKSDKILLRPLQLSDLDFLFEIENNKENWKFGSEEVTFTKDDLRSYIRNATEDISVSKQFRFVIDLENTPIGFIDLFDYTANSAGVGLIIAKNFRRRGFSKEVLKLLIDYATNILKIEKLHCNIQEDNFASINIFTSLGFELDENKEETNYYVLQNG